MSQFKNREEYEKWRASSPSTPDQPQQRNLPGAQGPSPSHIGPSGRKARNLFRDLPRWSWIFVVMCLAIPVITLGGALPGALERERRRAAPPSRRSRTIQFELASCYVWQSPEEPG